MTSIELVEAASEPWNWDPTECISMLASADLRTLSASQRVDALIAWERAELKRCLKRAVLRLDPHTAAENHARARADRCVRVSEADHGTAELWALLPAADAKVIHARLDGYREVTADVARALAADPSGTWRRLVIDPTTSHLLDFGRSTYRPPQCLRDFVTTRNPVCSFVGCNKRSLRCDLDHVCRWESGGITSSCNLHPLCRRHHRAKDEANWRARLNVDGTVNWTSPHGRRYLSRPPDRWPRHE